jgi:hypothetical protein
VVITRTSARPDERQQAALERALVQLDPEADGRAADHVEDGLQRGALGVQQQLVAGVEDPEVTEHLALRREQRCVEAGAGYERLDVVRDLSGEERLRVGAAERELAALGAVDQPGALGDRPAGVGGVSGGHASSVGALRRGWYACAIQILSRV